MALLKSELGHAVRSGQVVAEFDLPDRPARHADLQLQGFHKTAESLRIEVCLGVAGRLHVVGRVYTYGETSPTAAAETMLVPVIDVTQTVRALTGRRLAVVLKAYDHSGVERLDVPLALDRVDLTLD